MLYFARRTQLLCALIAMSFIGLADSPRPTKPNIVLMMADDMGIGDTSAYLGVRMGTKAEPIALTQRTPQLKSFAQQAVVFNNAYAPASMCSSTRYALLTGRFAHRCYLKQQAWLWFATNALVFWGVRAEKNRIDFAAFFLNLCNHFLMNSI